MGRKPPHHVVLRGPFNAVVKWALGKMTLGGSAQADEVHKPRLSSRTEFHAAFGGPSLSSPFFQPANDAGQESRFIGV